MGHSHYDANALDRRAWNAGKKVGTKRPLKPRQIWAIRFFLDRQRRVRDRALFDLAIDSKLRGCDLVKIKTGTLVVGSEIRTRAIVVQQKTGRPAQFELMSDARYSLLAWLERRGGTVDDYAFPSRIDPKRHMSTRQYARLVDEWVVAIGLRPQEYGTHSLRRTKRPSSTRRPVTCARSRFCWATPRSRTQSVSRSRRRRCPRASRGDGGLTGCGSTVSVGPRSAESLSCGLALPVPKADVLSGC